ncbi:MAG: DNA polymerase III subunit gamma/tau [Alphaproteobacteria bacterium]
MSPKDRAPEADDSEGDGASPTIDDPNQISFLGATPGSQTPPTGSNSPAATTSGNPPPPTNPSAGGSGYRVLARQYRPQSFADLVGQEALVRTLRNAFARDRVAHAFILTGIRGTGKTTTARIIAKCLNCIGADGTGGPTIEPCGVCEHCRAITEDRHLDVIEMDAASRTGVDDIREILDGVRYKPVSARNKVYIIDEVHMLSRNAFNALLKTLEEPPSNVTFIFATTEIRKVPVTVMSRCQRFDLRRIPAAILVEHLGRLAKAEGAEVPPEALRLLARAGDGSARDAVSLLDQAIAHGDGTTSEGEIRAMLGLADAGLVYDLFEALMGGEIAPALDLLQGMYQAGADPIVVLQDLLELTHWLTRIKVAPQAVADTTLSELEHARGQEMAEKLPIAELSRAWQLLLKGLAETKAAPAALPAAEMVLIRLAHMTSLPPPAEVIKRLQGTADAATGAPSTAPPAASRAGAGPQAMARPQSKAQARHQSMAQAQPQSEAQPQVFARPEAEAQSQVEARPQAVARPEAGADPADFRALVALFAARREARLHNLLHNEVRLVAYEPGRLEIALGDNVQRDLPGRILACLREWCGAHWQVSVSDAANADDSLADQDEAAKAAITLRAEQHPTVRAVLDAFPGAHIQRVTSLASPTDTLDPTADPEDGSPSEDDAMLVDDLSNGDNLI